MRKKIKLYNEALQKSERYERKVADVQPKTAKGQILLDLEEQMEKILHLQKPLYLLRSGKNPDHI